MSLRISGVAEPYHADPKLLQLPEGGNHCNSHSCGHGLEHTTVIGKEVEVTVNLGHTEKLNTKENSIYN